MKGSPDSKNVLFLRTNSFRCIFDSLKDFDIIELTAYRNSGREISNKKSLFGTGVTFGESKTTFMHIHHTSSMTQLNIYKDEIFKIIDDLQLHDVIIDSLTAISKEKIPFYKDKVVIRFQSMGIEDQRIKDEESDYNKNELRHFAAKRGVLLVTMMCTHYQYISVQPSKRDYVVLLSPNWRDHGFKDQDFASDIEANNFVKEIIGKDYAFDKKMKENSSKKLVFSD